MSYNVQDLFFEVFGIRVQKSYELDFNKESDEEEPVERGFMGTEVLHPITLLGGNYKHYTNEGKIEMRDMPDFRLPIASIVDFSRDKIIGTTRVNNGIGGSVKEIFTFDDWNITIRGFCVLDLDQHQGHKTAFEQETELLKWDNVVDSIGVSGKLFDVRDIDHLVIKSISMTALRGKPKIKPFVINAISDKPLLGL